MSVIRIIRRILLVRWLLKRRNYLGAVQYLGSLPVGRSIPGNRVESAADAIASRCDRIPGTRCLARSLVLWSLLREAGHDSEIRIGVRPRGSGIEAHAWIEWNGRPLMEADDPRSLYTAFEGDMSELQFKL